MKSRTLKAKYNIVTSIGLQLITLVSGMYLPQLFLKNYGSEVYGAIMSIGQFLAYVTLLQGGIAGVARAALYRPLADGDEETIGGVMTEMRVFFRIIAMIFVAYTFILACAYKSISDLMVLDWLSTFFLVLALSLSSLARYFFGITKAILLRADQKLYVDNLLRIGSTILNMVLAIVLIYADCSVVIVKLVSGAVFALNPLVLTLYVKKHYKFEYQKGKKEEKYLSQKWEGLGQHIAYFLHSNTDTVLLTLFTNLKLVSVYAVYNMVMTHMKSTVLSFVGDVEAVFGNLLANKEQQKLQAVFGYYDTLTSTVSNVLFSAAAILILPFVQLYTKSVTDINYIVPVFAMVIVFSEYLYCVRFPYEQMIMAAGHFKQTRVAAYGEAIINVVLSLVLVKKYQLIGVAVATMIATLFRLVFYVIYLKKNLIYREMRFFAKRMSVNLAVIAGNVLLGRFLLRFVSLQTFVMWIAFAVVVCIFVSATSILVSAVLYTKDMKEIFKRLKRVKH